MTDQLAKVKQEYAAELQGKDETISDLVRRAESLEHSLLQKQGSFSNLQKAKNGERAQGERRR